NLSNAQLTGVHWQLRTMRRCYLGIRGLDSCFGNALFKRAAADQDFLDTLEAHLKGTRRMALFRAWGGSITAAACSASRRFRSDWQLFMARSIGFFLRSWISRTARTPGSHPITSRSSPIRRWAWRYEAGHSGGRDNCQQRCNSRLHDTRFAPFSPRAKHRAPQLNCD